jgi:hypothetical protein
MARVPTASSTEVRAGLVALADSQREAVRIALVSKVLVISGRQPAEMIVPLDQHDVGARPRRSDRGDRAGRPAAGDRHVAIAEQRHPALRFGDRSGGLRPRLAQPLGAEHLGR